MRTHSNDFKNLIKEYGRQFNDTIYYNNTTYNGDHIFSVNYSVDSSIFKSVMQTLKIDTDIPMNVGDTLDYGISVVGANDEIRFNNFIVNKIEEQKDKKSKLVTCYDNMIKTMKDYKTFFSPTSDTTFIDSKNYYYLVDNEFKRYKGDRTGNPSSLYLYESPFPIQLRAYITLLCSHLGITFKNRQETFTNYNKMITSEHYVDIDNNSLGYTFRDVFDDLAEATGSFIFINSSGQLEIKSFTNTQDTINEDYFNDKNVNIGKKVGPYNVLVLSRASDSDTIHRPTTLPQNPIELKISNNPILEQDNREDFIDGIYNNINGLEFYLNDFTTTGILYYEIGDKYNVSIDNTTYPCLMLSDNIKRTTGLKENIHTNEPPQSVTDYKYSSTTDKVEISSRNASIKVDKANASIEQIVEAVGDDGEVTGASIIMAINDDESNLSLNADKINLNGAVTANNNFKINTNGSVEINNGSIELTDDGETTIHPRISVSWVNHSLINELYSSGLYITSNDGYAKKESSITYNGYNHIDTDLQTNRKQFFEQNFNTIYMSEFDENGNTERWAFLFPGADTESAFKLGYGSNTNVEITNHQSGSLMTIKGDLETKNSNNTTTFEVDGTNGNTTIGGDLSANNILTYQRGSYDVNTLFDNTISVITGGSNCPSGQQYGVVLTLPYRKTKGNTTTDFVAQMFLPNGDDNTSPNSLFFRTSYSNGWRNWQELTAIQSGTWTPTISSSNSVAPTVTYTNRRGTYKKMGKMVYIDFYIRGKITALASGNNYAMITGIPFIPKSAALGEISINKGVCYATHNNWQSGVTFNIYTGPAQIRVMDITGANTQQWIVTTTNYFEIGGNGWYETSQ